MKGETHASRMEVIEIERGAQTEIFYSKGWLQLQ